MALGADGRNIKSLIIRQGMRPVVTGAVIGMDVAAISNLMSGLLFKVSPGTRFRFVRDFFRRCACGMLDTCAQGGPDPWNLCAAADNLVHEEARRFTWLLEPAG
jgi:hypothetical protein